MIKTTTALFLMLVGLAGSVLGQSVDIPAQTHYKAYRLLGVPSGDTDPTPSFTPVPSATAVPEPGSLALLLVGGASFAGLALRKRRSAKI
jgi:PEP-CTERM motif